MVASTVIEPGSTAGSGRRGSAGAEPWDEQARLLAVVGDPTRLAVLGALRAGTTCVCRLQEQVPVAANLLSYHLKVLREAGLIIASRRGRWIDYRLAPRALQRLHGALPGRCGPGDERS